MHASTTVPHAAGGPLPLFAGILRSEARKLGTVRSTFWALLAAVAFNVVTAALLGIFLPGHLSAHQKAAIDSVRVSLGGLHLSQIAACSARSPGPACT
jgi:ABC-2 type transport system permease protein